MKNTQLLILSIVAAICISDVKAACKDECPAAGINFFKVFCNKVCACDSNPCGLTGTCAETDDGFACTCRAGYTGKTCETDIDDCEGKTCQNGGVCFDGVNQFTCVCLFGFTGEFCENAIPNACCPDPCENGVCTQDAGNPNGYTCTCEPGFTGDDCDTEVNECDTQTCSGKGDCSELGYNAYLCTCNKGYTGTDCEIDVNDCSAINPCVNGGTCADGGENSATCSNCNVGFDGPFCANNVDNCNGNNCNGNGVCVDQVDSYKCICNEGFKGVNCETSVVCAADPCVNGGTCASTGLTDLTCTGCNPDYTGSKCEDVIDHCSEVNCGQGVCIDGVGSFKCVCNEGFRGEYCDIDVSCDANPCVNGGTCVPDGSGSFVCNGCNFDYTGAKCTTQINDCSSNPCQNGGTCVDRVGDYYCKCNSLYTGRNCDISLSCAAGYDRVDGVGCLKFVASNIPFADTLLQCYVATTNIDKGGRLYSYEPEDSITALRDYWYSKDPGNPLSTWWVGLEKDSATSSWDTWINFRDNPVTFDSSHPFNEETGECGAITFDGTSATSEIKFIKRVCSYSHAYLCEGPAYPPTE